MIKFFLLILALSWAFIVHALVRGIGYEPATGYPDLLETLIWAIPAALPLLIGVLVANNRIGWQRILRWVCAGLLALEIGFLFITWLGIIFFLLPLLGIVLLMWPEISEQPLNLPPKPKLNQEEKKQRNKIRLQFFLIGVIGLTWVIWQGWFHNPLPSDDEMIRNFNEHRAEFEQLVQEYRNFRYQKGDEHTYYAATDGAKLLMEKLNVSNPQVAGHGWVPTPYSNRAAKFRKGRNIAAKIKLGRLTHSPDPEIRSLAGPEDWRQVMPEIFEGVPPITSIKHLGQHTGRMSMRYGYPRPIWGHSWRYFLGTGMVKNYYHFPQPPRVENGYFLWPHMTIDGDPIARRGSRVFDSLNDFPPNWEKGECVMRRIDPKWFITMCRGA